MDKQTIEIKTPFLSGVTVHIEGDFISDAGMAYEPDTVTMSVYDVVESQPAPRYWPFHVWHPGVVPSVSSALVNGRNDVDVSAYVDAQGHVDLELDVEDTTIDVPTYISHLPYKRIVHFTFEWASPAKRGKKRIVLNIVPDRETVAA